VTNTTANGRLNFTSVMMLLIGYWQLAADEN